MIVQNEKREVLTTSHGEEINFSINVNDPNIFNILRSSLYTNPIKSVVREIISNAVDAHSNANIKEPIEITCPGEYFVVKDFGGGISPERMKAVFSVYGASTKREDNSQIGGFGIGAKSPFSVCDQYLIITHYNGMRYTYQAYIDATGIGKIKIISENSSDDKGTTVKIPVKSSQTYEFKNAVLHYSRHLRVYPKIHGGHYGYYSEPTERAERVLEGEKWAIFKQNPECNLLVDQIPYTIDSYNLNIPTNFVFLFETGELEIAAARESVRLTPNNVEKLKEIVEDYQRTYRALVQDKLEKADTIEEVFEHLNKLPTNARHEWEWKDLKFGYPFIREWNNPEKDESVSSCSLGYKRRIEKSYHTKIYPNGKNCIYAVKDFNGFSPYDNRRIKSHMERENLSVVYIINDKFLEKFLVKTVNLADIKCQPGGTRNAPKFIRGKKHLGRSHALIPLNIQDEVVYCLEWPEYQTLHKLPFEIYKIAPKHQKFVEDKENWYTIDEYLEEKITSKYNEQQMISMYRNWYYNQNFSNFIQFHSLFNESDFEPAKTNNHDGKLLEFMKANDMLKPGKIFNPFDKYPMLKVVDTYKLRHDSISVVKDYIKDLNERSKK